MKDGKTNMEEKMEDRLTRLRKEKGYSQSQLAEQIHVCRQSISEWEKGSTCPTQDNLLQLSEIYGVSVDYLLGKAMPPAAPAETPQEEVKQESPTRPDGIFIKFRWITWGIIVLLAAAVLVLALQLRAAKAELAEREMPIPMGELSFDTIEIVEGEFD